MKSIKSCLIHLLNPLLNQVIYLFSSSNLNAKINSFQNVITSFWEDAITEIKELLNPHLLGNEYVMLNIIK